MTFSKSTRNPEVLDLLENVRRNAAVYVGRQVAAGLAETHEGIEDNQYTSRLVPERQKAVIVVQEEARKSMSAAPSPWQPGSIRKVVLPARATASQVVVVETDQGNGYLKAMGNPAGTHSLAVELVATRLADWFRLPILTASIIHVTGVPPIELQDNPRRFALPGPAFITREEAGRPWSGAQEELDVIDNAEDLARVIVFDTWVRNCDRHMPRARQAHVNRGNVFLSEEGASKGRFILKPIDHGQCFCFATEFTPTLLRAETAVRDECLYGYFPEFRGRVREPDVRQAIAQVAAIQASQVEALFTGLPAEWRLSAEMQDAWCDLVLGRAAYLNQNVERIASLL